MSLMVLGTSAASDDRYQLLKGAERLPQHFAKASWPGQAAYEASFHTKAVAAVQLPLMLLTAYGY
jgi:hypothetical protein